MNGYLSGTELAELRHWAVLSAGTALEVGHYEGLSTSVLLQSLSSGVVLYSVDHHAGDHHVEATQIATFEENVSELRHSGPVLIPVYRDFREFATWGITGFGFVFYDAEHSVVGCRDFWGLFAARMLPDCLLLYDDADWGEMVELGRLAERAGFVDVTRLPFQRLNGDKQNAQTYTLKVLRRGRNYVDLAV